MKLAVLFSGILLGLLAGKRRGEPLGRRSAPGLLTSLSSAESPGNGE